MSRAAALESPAPRAMELRALVLLWCVGLALFALRLARRGIAGHGAGAGQLERSVSPTLASRGDHNGARHGRGAGVGGVSPHPRPGWAAATDARRIMDDSRRTSQPRRALNLQPGWRRARATNRNCRRLRTRRPALAKAAMCGFGVEDGSTLPLLSPNGAAQLTRQAFDLRSNGSESALCRREPRAGRRTVPPNLRARHVERAVELLDPRLDARDGPIKPLPLGIHAGSVTLQFLNLGAQFHQGGFLLGTAPAAGVATRNEKNQRDDHRQNRPRVPAAGIGCGLHLSPFVVGLGGPIWQLPAGPGRGANNRCGGVKPGGNPRDVCGHGLLRGRRDFRSARGACLTGVAATLHPAFLDATGGFDRMGVQRIGAAGAFFPRFGGGESNRKTACRTSARGVSQGP